MLYHTSSTLNVVGVLYCPSLQVGLIILPCQVRRREASSIIANMQLSDTERHKIVFEFERCKSIRKVSGKLGYHRNTVRRWVNKAKARK
jgi:hypothetical protein